MQLKEENGQEHICSMSSFSATENFTVHFETLGCRLNQIETESAARYFYDCGFSIHMESATTKSVLPQNILLCVVNTCTVTAKAEQKARRLIRLLLRRCPKSCVLVTGCYAQVEKDDIASIDKRICVLPGLQKDLLIDISNFLKNYVLTNLCSDSGNDTILNIDEVSDYVRKICTKPKENIYLTTPPAFRLTTDTFFMHSRSAIKIQDGCNNSCSYCRIRIARGKAVSLDATSVINRVQQLEKQGQHEVVLTGVNLSQYKGSWENGFVDLVGLLELLLSSTNKISFRLSSLYPERIDEKFCHVIQNARIQPHFHLSVQSGSNKILELMGRSYKDRDILQAVSRLRNVKDNPFIACDIIVGFPEETDADFQDTMELCKNAQFAWVHVFPFSARPGTKAYSMNSQVPQIIANERAKQLTEFAIESKCSYISLWKGKVVSAVTEFNRSDRNDFAPRKTHAVTENFIHVELPAKFEQGKLLQVKIGEPQISWIKQGKESEALAEVVHNEKIFFTG